MTRYTTWKTSSADSLLFANRIAPLVPSCYARRDAFHGTNPLRIGAG